MRGQSSYPVGEQESAVLKTFLHLAVFLPITRIIVLGDAEHNDKHGKYINNTMGLYCDRRKRANIIWKKVRLSYAQ